MTFPVGETLDGRYLVRREVAHGSHSVVFEAQHVRTCRSVAVKMHPATVQQQSVERDVLLAEAKLLGELHHPGLVEVLDAGEARAPTSVGSRMVPYLALEMVEGRSLAGVLASRGVLSVADCVRVVLALCDTMATVHASAVVHGDITPANVFLPVQRTEQRSGWPGIQDVAAKLLGFGAAVRAITLSSTEEVSLDSAPYMSAERLRGAEIDALGDVYSIGCVLYACLTGGAPHIGKGLELLRANSPRPVVAPQEIRPEVPPALAQVALQAIAIDPAQRYEDPAALGRAVVAAIKEAKQASARRSQAEIPAPPSQQLPPVPPSSPALFGPENRRFDRASYLAPVRIIRQTGAHFDGQCEDLSEGGMLVIAADILDDAETVGIRFALPVTGKIVTLQAVARWCREAREGRGAIGLEFLDLPADVRKGIIGYVKHFGA